MNDGLRQAMEGIEEFIVALECYHMAHFLTHENLTRFPRPCPCLSNDAARAPCWTPTVASTPPPPVAFTTWTRLY